MSDYVDDLRDVDEELKNIDKYKKIVTTKGGLDSDTYALLAANFGHEHFSEIDDRLVHDYPTMTYESYALNVLNTLHEHHMSKYGDIYTVLEEKISELYPVATTTIYSMRSDLNRIKSLLSKHAISEINIDPSEKPQVAVVEYSMESEAQKRRLSITAVPIGAAIESGGRLGKLLPAFFNIDTPVDGKDSIVRVFAHQLIVGKLDIDALYYSYVNGVTMVPPVLYGEVINSHSSSRVLADLIDLIRELSDIDYTRTRQVLLRNNVVVDAVKAVSVCEWLFSGDNSKRTRVISSGAVSVLEELIKYNQ